MTTTIELNETWLHGKYPAINAEINTALSYVAIDSYFWQGSEADTVISEIHQIWLTGDCSVEQAILKYSSFYF